MAHYLFASTPLYGHVAPMIAAGRALCEAGHRVTMLTGSRFETVVRGAGLDFVPLSGRADFDERDLESYLPDRARYRGVALSQYQIQHTFIHPIPEQWRVLRRILSTHSIDALAVDHLFAGAVPLLAQPRGERIPVLAFGIGPVAQLSRDTAPPGMALQPSWSVPGRLRNRALNALATHVVFVTRRHWPGDSSTRQRASRCPHPFPSSSICPGCSTACCNWGLASSNIR